MNGEPGIQPSTQDARKPRILLVEDDDEIASLIVRSLESQDIRATRACTLAQVEGAVRGGDLDMIVLDLMLPKEDGFEICRKLRAFSNVPILILSAKAEEVDRVFGLELGADDYLTKPFSSRELLARIKAIMRRTRSDDLQANEHRIYSFHGWLLNIRTRQLHNPAGALVPLTGAETDLLKCFCENCGKVLTREQLASLVQGRPVNQIERGIDVLVSRLRQKIEEDAKRPLFFQTIRSVGYVFTPEVAIRSGA